MSKSLGNGIDPLEMIDKYGCDALRMNLVTGNSPGNDTRFYTEKCEAMRNFANKLWNASRYVMMNLGENAKNELPPMEHLEIADKWVLSKLNTLIAEVTENLEKFELGVAVQKVYDFIWSQFCDWYIELSKARLQGEDKNLFYNDEQKDAYAALPEEEKEHRLRALLASLLKGTPGHVNLIPLNEVEESPLKPSRRVAAFQKRLESHGVTVTVRRKLGGDIDASCGQLRRKAMKAKEREKT